jgi:hypothetical protein
MICLLCPCARNFSNNRKDIRISRILKNTKSFSLGCNLLKCVLCQNLDPFLSSSLSGIVSDFLAVECVSCKFIWFETEHIEITPERSLAFHLPCLRITFMTSVCCIRLRNLRRLRIERAKFILQILEFLSIDDLSKRIQTDCRNFYSATSFFGDIAKEEEANNTQRDENFLSSNLKKLEEIQDAYCL